MALDRLPLLLGLLRVALGLQRLLRLDQHLRVLDEVLADDLPDGVDG